MSDLPNVDVVYYNKTNLKSNSSIYNPSHKQNYSPTDICYLQQTKSDVYNQNGENVGIFNVLNTLNIDVKHGINTGLVSVKTDKGIVTFINTYDIGTSTEPYIPDIIQFMRAVYASGIYIKNGLDVYVKVLRLNIPGDINETRKIEIFYH
jgi:hypothetical protein